MKPLFFHETLLSETLVKKLTTGFEAFGISGIQWNLSGFQFSRLEHTHLKYFDYALLEGNELVLTEMSLFENEE